jgi:hypothetical protein
MQRKRLDCYATGYLYFLTCFFFGRKLDVEVYNFNFSTTYITSEEEVQVTLKTPVCFFHMLCNTQCYHPTQKNAIRSEVPCKISFIGTRHQILKAINSALWSEKEVDWPASVLFVLRPELA